MKLFQVWPGTESGAASSSLTRTRTPGATLHAALISENTKNLYKYYDDTIAVVPPEPSRVHHQVSSAIPTHAALAFSHAMLLDQA
jgi:hypothetical protein